MPKTTAVAKRDLCNVAQVSNDATALMIKDRTHVDSTELAVYLRTVIGQCRLSQPLALELQRRFKNLDRKKQVDSTYLEIDGARSLNAWLEKHGKQIGSKRNFYYVRDGGKKPAPQVTDGKAEDGDEAGGNENEDSPVSAFIFAKQLQKSVVDEIRESDYSLKEKQEITVRVMRHLQQYSDELELSVNTITIPATEEAEKAQGASV